MRVLNNCESTSPCRSGVNAAASSSPSLGPIIDNIDHHQTSSTKKKCTCLTLINDPLDLTLLKDPIFMNMIIGLSFGIVSYINYIVLLPLIMRDRNLNINETATVMSATSITEIIFRLLAPYVAKLLGQQERVMFVLTLICTILVTSGSLFISGFLPLMICSAINGMFIGLQMVYSALVLPNYVPVEKMPISFGLLYSLNGLEMLIAGFLFGLVKDLTGTYVNCIHLMNLISSIPVITWTIEAIVRKQKIHRSLNITI